MVNVNMNELNFNLNQEQRRESIFGQGTNGSHKTTITNINTCEIL
jgi:hypothetical protein